MKCPRCASETTVIDSREVLAGAAVRRRRVCSGPGCRERFTTYERRPGGPKPPPPDPCEVLHLRAALALAGRGDLSLVEPALARDWKQCEQREALAIVLLSVKRGNDVGPV